MSGPAPAAGPPRRRPVDVPALVEGVLAGRRGDVARALTLVESRRADHRAQAQDLLGALLPRSGRAVRLGVTGVPGVGKSTFVEALGTRLTASGHRVAVLAVDPSSSRSGGSILGDKTRMARLATDPAAFVRPSPTAGTLGGVARTTREAVVVLEAAGYDVVVVETVGVGQSEAVVAQMVDTFCVLVLARTGDSLQGIKKGVLELADLLVVHKADGPAAADARSAASEARSALRLVTPPDALWHPPVLEASSTEDRGVAEVWEAVLEHRRVLEAAGELARRRGQQQVQWMRAVVEDELLAQLRAPAARAASDRLAARVREGDLPATAAAAMLLAELGAGGPRGAERSSGEDRRPPRR
ncbi:methylmalonyl Co-A mutase-associated GTPase MeaB [uncultured Pseudokineococcus sp.]|uniref:methylmalonyl Co-A mutase-associated GTPase MeaB n=1 Tax=uncultured Pseudokineococcus sp. TaxID=1642928 RepID=UPI00262B5B31|nr:methylmalonyl Co-A mutase-associated GTPase MeaB [uncultured Pseudokineococcus sp.]